MINNIVLFSPEEAVSVIVDAFNRASETLCEIQIRVDQIRESVRIKIIIAGTCVDYYLESAVSTLQDWFLEMQCFVGSLFD